MQTKYAECTCLILFMLLDYKMVLSYCNDEFRLRNYVIRLIVLLQFVLNFLFAE